MLQDITILLVGHILRRHTVNLWNTSTNSSNLCITIRFLAQVDNEACKLKGLDKGSLVTQVLERKSAYDFIIFFQFIFCTTTFDNLFKGFWTQSFFNHFFHLILQATKLLWISIKCSKFNLCLRILSHKSQDLINSL